MDTLKRCLVMVFLLAGCFCTFAQEELLLFPEDVRIDQSREGGYLLYVRAGEEIASVLITESSAHPDRRVDSYAFRNPSFHPENGEELRVLEGQILDPRQTGRYFLVDSSPEEDPVFGQAFRIFIPYLLEYGYPWSRNGVQQILDGSWINIRTFSLPYADYEGGFRDNPFRLRLIQKERVDDTAYMEAAREAYEEISEEGEGDMVFGQGAERLVDDIASLIDKQEARSLDLVLCLDTTKSMEEEMPHLQKSLTGMLSEKSRNFERFRFGLVLYKDYYEEYVNKAYPFQENSFAKLQQVLDSVRVYGGRDIPEAVYEALYEGLHYYPWAAEQRILILVGDAPPHPMPRGKIDKEMVYNDAKDLGVALNVIILPQ